MIFMRNRGHFPILRGSFGVGSGSGLGYWDLVSSIKKLAVADVRFQISDYRFQGSESGF